MAIILIGHEQIKAHNSPEHDTYDRTEPKLHKAASALVQESVDCILYAKQKTITKATDTGFGTARTRAITTGERVVACIGSPAFIAKNRYGLPAELPLLWSAFSDAIAASRPQAQSELKVTTEAA